MQDPRELPEWIQREANAYIAHERRQRILAGVAASLILGGLIIGLAALATMSAELGDMTPAPAERPIAP